MLDFPANPTLGQQYIAAGITWTWDGVKWTTGVGAALVPAMNDNRIINGDFRIDQRNGGAAGTANGYTVDRWLYSSTQTSRITWQQLGSPTLQSLTGFHYGLRFISSSAYTPLAADYFNFRQPIEADFIEDFNWGTPNAQPVTLSFWAFSSLAGLFGGSMWGASPTRSYPFSFNLPNASTWTKIVITIPGDTVGAWTLTGNGAGVLVFFDLGAGANFRGPAGAWASADYRGANGAQSIVATNGASFNITGVKLEVGSVATPYNRYSLAKCMADCQRYYQVGSFYNSGTGNASAGTGVQLTFPVTMRASPTVTPAYTTQSNCGSSTMSTPTVNGVIPYTTVTATSVFAFAGNFTASAEL